MMETAVVVGVGAGDRSPGGKFLASDRWYQRFRLGYQGRRSRVAYERTLSAWWFLVNG